MELPARHKQTLLNFLRWWKQGFSYLLPAKFRRTERPQSSALWLTVVAEGIQCRVTGDDASGLHGQLLTAGNDQISTAIQAFQANGQSVVLVLTSEQVLRTRLQLPGSIGDEIRNALEFELDRRTPFKADQVYFDFKKLNEVASRDGQLDIDLVVVPREIVDSLLQQLQQLSIKPDRVDVQLHAGQLGGFSLQPPEELAHDSQGARRNERALWLFAATLAAISLALPLLKQLNYIATLEEQIEHERSVITRLDVLQQEKRALLTRLDVFSDDAVRGLPAIVILDELTRQLPDDTWLQRMTLSGDTLHLIGESANASLLIEVIQSIKYLTNAQFRSPVTHNEQTQKEKFQLSAQLIEADDV